jgi:hypothetical protein
MPNCFAASNYNALAKDGCGSALRTSTDVPAHRQNYDLGVEVPLPIDRVASSESPKETLAYYTPQVHQNLFVVIRLGYPCERAT